MLLCEIDERVLSGVPNYTAFLTVDELNRRSEDLASRYPRLVELVPLGRSRSGDPIHALKIKGGRDVALLFGCPHPNEPIGSLMLDYLAERLVTNDEFRMGLDYTWLIIKCIDPDGTRLNEGWFESPFHLETYVRNFYRPPGFQQVEWTFPVHYKRLRFDSPLPETQCLMRIIEQEKPRFLYSLHNTSFGGVYWYVTGDIPELYPSFYSLARRYRLP
ncbi:MAG TPA: peptidase M14, partial [Firmicutes bacterium]|nr:peptidase M14 [Bacillota bacterium]